MINSSASGNFIATSFARRYRFATWRKNQEYELIAVDRSFLPSVDRETIPLPLAIQSHYEEITFDVTDIASHNVVLGMPWLEKHNPGVD